MGWNEALQGLLGGVNQGLGGFLDQRQQAQENEMKARQVQVQEAEAKRAQQAQEWEETNAAYKQLMGEVDAPTAQRFVNRGLPMQKGPGGGLMRPLGAQEQVALQGINPEFIAKEAELKFAPQAANAALGRTHDVQIQGMRNAQDEAGLANALKIAGMNNATSRYNTERNTDARVSAAEAQAQAAMQRLNQGALIKPIDDMDFQGWMRTEYLRDPVNKKYFEEATAAGVPQTALMQRMREIYARSRTPLVQ